MRDYYAQRAREYDAIYKKPERQNDIVKLGKLFKELLADKIVLEIACGTGFWTQIYAPNTHFTTATDINTQMLSIAEKRLSESSKVALHTADAFDLFSSTSGLFNAGKFNAGIAAFWWSHLKKSEINSFLLSLHSALRPGSIVIFADNLFVQGSNTPISKTDSMGNSYQFRKLLNDTTTEIVKNFPSEDEFRSRCAKHGIIKGFRKFTYFWCGWYELLL